MDGVSVKRRVVVVGLAALLLAFPSMASANPRALQKTRPGSVLKKDAGFEPSSDDLRGELERRRDQELLTHFQRMAELDVIAEVAKAARDLGLQERVEDVRRREVQRHHRAMMRLRKDSEAALWVGAP